MRSGWIKMSKCSIMVSPFWKWAHFWEPEMWKNLRGKKRMQSNREFSICSNDGVFHVALYVHVQVYSNGRVTWTPPALYCSSCGVKVNTKFCLIHQIVISICKIITIYGIPSIGRVFPLWLAELLHAVPLLHLRLNRNRHPVRAKLERPRNQGGPAGWGFHWCLLFL